MNYLAAKDTAITLKAKSAPRIIRFKAEHGECTWVCFRGCNILIDGGYSKYPCFWPFVRSVDCLILSHGDGDHINGLMPVLFAQEQKELHFTSQVISHYYPKDAVTDYTKWSRTWFEAALFAAVCQKLKIAKEWTQNKRVMVKETKEFSVEVIVLFPSPDKVQPVLNKIARNSTSISYTDMNDSSLVCEVVIRLKKPKKVWRLLFTGDTPGDKFSSQNLYDYADVPHHGAASGKPSEFFARINANNYAISTNGNIYEHPDEETLQEYLRMRSDRKLWFNYSIEEFKNNRGNAIEEMLAGKTDYCFAKKDDLVQIISLGS